MSEFYGEELVDLFICQQKTPIWNTFLRLDFPALVVFNSEVFSGELYGNQPCAK